MNDLESQLHEALRPKQPPDGFERRVLEKVGATRRSRWRQRIAASIAACLLLAFAGSYWQREREQAREAERAKTQLIQALRITGEKLQLVERSAVENLNRQEH